MTLVFQSSEQHRLANKSPCTSHRGHMEYYRSAHPAEAPLNFALCIPPTPYGDLCMSFCVFLAELAVGFALHITPTP